MKNWKFWDLQNFDSRDSEIRNILKIQLSWEFFYFISTEMNKNQ